MIKKQVLTALAIVSLTPAAFASPLYDQNVNEPSPGVFYGSGNANGSWTVDTANGIELALRTKQRVPAANIFNSAGNGNYNWTDNTLSGLASWNYDFSLNVIGTPSDLLTDYRFALYIDSDPGVGHIWNVIDPSLIPDNHSFGTAYEQNSENPRFAFVGIPGYNAAIPGTYDFALFASSSSGAVLAETYMRVNVNGGTAGSSTFNGSVPDGGSSALLLGSAATALAFLRRKRSK